MVGARSHGTHAERALATADAGGGARVEGDHESEQRAAGPGAAGGGSAGGGAGAELRGGSTRGRVAARDDGQRPGAAVQPGRAWGEAAGVPVWCQDEAGPYQAIPQAGVGRAPVGEPARLPHEYVRGGTAKLLTLFRPATGEVRAKGVTNAPNAVLHPWLQAELTEVLATLPPITCPDEERPPLARWATWLGHEPTAPLPPLRLLLIWDNLAGHLSWSIVHWLLHHGVMPLYTPLSGSWLNMAESV